MALSLRRFSWIRASVCLRIHVPPDRSSWFEVPKQMSKISKRSMTDGILSFLGWLVAALALWVLLVVLELYWNFIDWQPKLDSRALGLGFGICSVLAGVWWLACTNRSHTTRGASLVICLALLVLAIYVFPPEPLTSGLFARQRSSPLWYRAGRFAVLVLPTLFWVLASIRHNNTACKPDASTSGGRTTSVGSSMPGEGEDR